MYTGELRSPTLSHVGINPLSNEAIFDTTVHDKKFTTIVIYIIKILISPKLGFLILQICVHYVKGVLKDKSGADKIIVKKQLYQLLNTSREFLPSFDASSFHKLVNESSSVKPNIVVIL